MPTPVLETERLILRPVRASDLDDIVMYVANPDVALWTAKIPHPYTEQDAHDWFAHVEQAEAAGTEHNFILEDKATKRLVGELALRIFRDSNSGGFGYWIGAPYWNKGFMSEAAARVVRYAFEDLALDTLRVTARPDNIASIRVQEKLGLRYVGQTIEEAPARGRQQRAVAREITRAEWQRMEAVRARR